MGNITLIPNQPIVFDQPDESCGCDTVAYKQIIDKTDITSIQFLVDPCPGIPNIICNPDFDTQECWTILKGWTITGGLAIKDLGTSGTMQYLDATEVGKLYQITINVKTLIGTLEFMSGSQLIKTITTPGIYTFNFEATGLYLQFFMSGANNDYCELESVTLFPLSENLAYGIVNEAGVTVAVVAYQDAPETFCFAGNHVTINISWAEIPDGCYTIGLTNGCLNTCGQAGVPNGSFLSEAQYWDETIVAGTPVSTFTGTQLNVTGTTADEVDFLHNHLTLCAGKEYNVTVDILRLLNADLTIRMGTQTQNVAAEGVTTFTLTADGTDLTLEFDMNGATSQLYLASIEISLANIEDYTFDYTSIPIKLETGVDCKFKKISICGDDDAWGFAFEGTCFFPKIRVDSRFSMGGYPNDREMNEFNNGFRQVQWAESRKIRQLNVDMHPEYVYDFLRFIPVADHIYIDDVEYISEDDEIAVSVAADTTNTGTMSVNLAEMKALYNVNKGNEQNSCDPPGSFITEKPTDSSVTSNDLERVVTP